MLFDKQEWLLEHEIAGEGETGESEAVKEGTICPTTSLPIQKLNFIH